MMAVSLLPFLLMAFIAVPPSHVVLVEASSAQELSNNDRDCEMLPDGTCAVHPDSSSSHGDISSSSSTCQDVLEDCRELAEGGQCISDFARLRHECPKTCLLCDNWDGLYKLNLYSDENRQLIAEPKLDEYAARVDEYMYEVVYSDTPRPLQPSDQGTSKPIELETYESVRAECKNRNEHCTFWASIGECTANPNYMRLHCAPACFSCESVLFETRCPFNKDAPRAWETPGDLNRTFARILENEAFAKYNPRALSQPRLPSLSDDDNFDDSPLDGPWVVVLDDFLTHIECDVLIELGSQRGYERSKDVGKIKFDGTYDDYENKGRTSSNAWCHDECYDHEVTQSVHRRMEDLIRIPRANYEHLQLLRYAVGQRYTQHHDYIYHHVKRAQGVRILTIFLYLNDVVEGGGTKFPYLNNLVVTPKKGRALIWPSVLDSDPNRFDERMDHEALPVIQGVKYGANAWVHQRDFKTPFENDCH